MSLDPRSMRRLAQLMLLVQAELEHAGPDAEVVLRVRKRAGEIIGRDSRVERLITSKLVDAEAATGIR